MKAKLMAGAVIVANVAAGIDYAHALGVNPADADLPELVPYTATGSSASAFDPAREIDASEPAAARLRSGPGWSIETRPPED